MSEHQPNSHDSLAPLPLSDQELDQLLRNGKAVPPTEFSERFWQDLEPKLDQTPERNPRFWMRPSLVAAAAGLVVMLLALPVAIKMGPQNEDAASVADLSQPPSSPMNLGTGTEEPESKEAPAANLADTDNAEKPEAAADKTKQEALTAPARPHNQYAARQRQAQQPQRQQAAPQQAQTKSVDMTHQIAELLEPVKGQVHKLEQDRYELKVPASQSDELKTRLKDWEIPHDLFERGMHEKGQVIYRLELK